MKLLKDLYYINSKSNNEEEISQYVQKRLDKLQIRDYQTTKEHIIHRVIPDTPLICAHMDQVGRENLRDLVFCNGKVYGNSNIGADDKNGVWILLQILKKIKNVSFIFSVGEETGGRIKNIPNISKLLESIKYGIIFDRRGSGDIICEKNNYGTEEFEKALVDIGTQFGFKPEKGCFSDCNYLSEHISCCNLSCGYYNAHTDAEYTIISELQNSLAFGLEFLDKVDAKFDKPEKTLYTNLFRYDSKRDYSGFGALYGDYSYWNEKYYCYTCEKFIDKSKLKGVICPFCLGVIEEAADDILFETEDFDIYCAECYSTYKIGEIKEDVEKNFHFFDEVICPDCYESNSLFYADTEIEVGIELFSDEEVVYRKFCPYCDTFEKESETGFCDNCGSRLVSIETIY